MIIKKIKVIIFSIFMLILFGCVQQKKSDENQLDNLENKSVSDIMTSKMEIQKELFNESDYDQILYSIIENCYPDYENINFEQLDETRQTFVLIVNLDGQITNGGMIQFIDNSTGNLFYETIEAAERIKSKILLEILTKASE